LYVWRQDVLVCMVYGYNLTDIEHHPYFILVTTNKMGLLDGQDAAAEEANSEWRKVHHLVKGGSLL
jgi:hypothetical protein